MGPLTADLNRLVSLKESAGLVCVTALYYVDPWLYKTSYSWELPGGVQQRLLLLAEPVRAVFPSH